MEGSNNHLKLSNITQEKERKKKDTELMTWPISHKEESPEAILNIYKKWTAIIRLEAAMVCLDWLNEIFITSFSRSLVRRSKSIGK